MITEIDLKHLDNLPIKVLKKKPPQSTNKDLPPLFFTSLFIGAKGSGKTYSLVKLLKFYEASDIIDDEGNKRQMRIILFCPTADSIANPIYRSLKNLADEDVYTHYTDDILAEKLEEINEEYEVITSYNDYIKTYHKYIKDYSKLTDEDLEILHEHNFKKPSELEKPPFKHPRVQFIIFDDLIGDAMAFKKNKGNILNRLVITHRHLQCNLLFTTQYIKAIPAILRANMDIFVIFKFASKKIILEKIYPELSGLITENAFLELYDYATIEPNSSLISINHAMNKQTNGFRKAWNKKLVLS
jgi:hypothetical protein